MAGERAQGEKRLAALAKVAGRFKGLKPAVSALTNVRSVPTIFPDIDRGLGVGGFPIERFSLLHGPSSHGKTSLALGLVASFLELDHYGLFIDAERTTPFDWVRQMLGPMADHPAFLAKRPETYEQTRADVREFCKEIAKAKEAGELPEDTSGIIIVDSLKKLVPKDLWEQIFGSGNKDPKKKDGMLKRMGQLKAAMNSAWLDELVPLLERSGVGMVAIAREMENTDGNQFTPDYKVGGGKDVFFDSSLAMRVERASWVQEGEEAARKVYGERHRVTIYKSKIAGKEGKVIQSYFHTSNGVLVPKGFDRARDIIELGLELEVVEMKGAWLSHDGERLGQGKHNAVANLAENPSWRKRIEAGCREAFKRDTTA